MLGAWALTLFCCTGICWLFSDGGMCANFTLWQIQQGGVNTTFSCKSQTEKHNKKNKLKMCIVIWIQYLLVPIDFISVCRFSSRITLLPQQIIYITSVLVTSLQLFQVRSTIYLDIHIFSIWTGQVQRVLRISWTKVLQSKAKHITYIFQCHKF